MADAKIGAVRQTSIATGVVPGQGVCDMWKLFSAEPVALTATVDSFLGDPANTPGFLLVESHFFGLWIQLVGAAPDVKVQILQSWDDVAADFAVPASGGTVTGSVADTSPHIYSIAPAPMP